MDKKEQKREHAHSITQEQYDRWIQNMNKNKSGTSWIYLYCADPDEYIKTKLYKDEKDKLYITWYGERIYLNVKI